MPIDAGSPSSDPNDLVPDLDKLADKPAGRGPDDEVDLDDAGTGAPAADDVDDDVDLDAAGKGAGGFDAADTAGVGDKADSDLLGADDLAKDVDDAGFGESLGSHVFDEQPDELGLDAASVKAGETDDDDKFDEPDDDKFDDDKVDDDDSFLD